MANDILTMLEARKRKKKNFLFETKQQKCNKEYILTQLSIINIFCPSLQSILSMNLSPHQKAYNFRKTAQLTFQITS
jgi:hypothetical protein